MKYTIIILIALLVAACSSLPSKRQLRSAAKTACALAHLSGEKEFEGKPIDYWCELGDEIIDVYNKITEKEKDNE